MAEIYKKKYEKEKENEKYEGIRKKLINEIGDKEYD